MSKSASHLSPIKLFITGTDTEIGKTYVSVGLLHAFHQLQLSTLGIKPIASGCVRKNNQLYNDDALQLQKASSHPLPYEKCNPFAFEPAIAPHIAAAEVQCELNLQVVSQKIEAALAEVVDVCVIEGFGGWYAPLNHYETMADFAIHHRLCTILVVGLRLGCINHSVLTHKAIQHDGVRLLGWIANTIDPEMAYCQETLATLSACLPTPCLGVVGYQERPENTLNVRAILNRLTA